MTAPAIRASFLSITVPTRLLIVVSCPGDEDCAASVPANTAMNMTRTTVTDLSISFLPLRPAYTISPETLGRGTVFTGSCERCRACYGPPSFKNHGRLVALFGGCGRPEGLAESVCSIPA